MRKFTLALLALLVISACNKNKASADPTILGDSDSKITFEEYAGLYCPGCAPFHKEGFDKLKAEFIDTGVIKYKFNPMPINPAAQAAAQILECSKKEDYYKVVTAFMSKDHKWPQPKPEDMPKKKDEHGHHHAKIDFMTPVKEIAAELGFNEQAFNACVGNQEAAKKLQEAGRETYKKLELSKMPSFVINGTKVEWIKTFDDAKKAIEAVKAGKNPNEEYEKAIAENLKVLPTDHVLGSPDAPNVLFEYASLSCSHCGDFATKELPKIKAQLIDTGKLFFVYRNYPLNKPALVAATVAQCAPKDKYFELIDALYANQKDWAYEEKFEAKLQGFTAPFGIDFAKCAADKATETRLLEVMKHATEKLEVSGTPALYLNGKRFRSVKADDIIKAVK